MELLDANRDAAGLCVVSAKATSQMIDHLPNLRVISRYGSGTDNIDVAAATERGILVTNVPEFCLSEVADHTMALLLGAARRLRELDSSMRSGAWLARLDPRLQRLAGKRLGLVGFGRIAQEVARRAVAFDLEVVAYDPQLDAAAAERLGVKPASLEELLPTSQYVSLHVPLLPSTRHLMNREAFARMRPEAILINTARGAVVDEAALIEALREGRIAGAAIDVYESLNLFGPPPDPLDHPLLSLPSVLLTPHAAACSAEALGDLYASGARNAIEALQGHQPAHCVNPSVLTMPAGAGY